MATILTLLTLIFLGLTAYVYVGYPLYLFLHSKIRQQPVASQATTPTVSLIIAAYNEEDVIREKLDNSLALDYPAEHLEIIVVTDGSSDSTPDLVAEYAEQDVKLMHSPERRGKSAAINRAVASAIGEVLLFSDANAFYPADTVHLLVSYFADSKVGIVGGRKTVVKSDSTVGASEGFYWKYESFIKKRESQIGSTITVVGEILSMRRSLFTPIPREIINDDFYLAMQALRQGYRVLYAPAAYSWETSASTARDNIIRRQRMTAGRYQALFRPGDCWPRRPFQVFQVFSHKFSRLLLPFFMIGALVCNVALVLFYDAHPLLWLTALGQVVAYGLALVGYVGEKVGRRFRLASIAYFIVDSNLATLRGLVSYLAGQQTVLWEKARRSNS